MLRVWLLFFLMLSSGSALAQITMPGCADTVPAPAAAVGYNTEIFCDHWPNLSSIDVNNVCGSNPAGQCINSSTGRAYKWFAKNGWPGLAQGGSNGFWAFNSVNSPSWFQLIGGAGPGLSYNVSGTLPTYNGGIVMSCATNGVANQWYGYAVPAASYIRFHVASFSPGNPTSGEAVLWTTPIEYTASAGPSSLWVEFDIFEGTGSTGYAAHLHEWTNAGGTEVPPASFIGNFSGTTTGVFGGLVVKASDNGGTGYAQAWEESGAGALSPDQTWSAGGRWSEIENHHQCLIITTGTPQTANITDVQVWSKYPLQTGIPGDGGEGGGGGRARGLWLR